MSIRKFSIYVGNTNYEVPAELMVRQVAKKMVEVGALQPGEFIAGDNYDYTMVYTDTVEPTRDLDILLVYEENGDNKGVDGYGNVRPSLMPFLKYREPKQITDDVVRMTYPYAKVIIFNGYAIVNHDRIEAADVRSIKAVELVNTAAAAFTYNHPFEGLMYVQSAQWLGSHVSLQTYSSDNPYIRTYIVPSSNWYKRTSFSNRKKLNLNPTDEEAAAIVLEHIERSNDLLIDPQHTYNGHRVIAMNIRNGKVELHLAKKSGYEGRAVTTDVYASDYQVRINIDAWQVKFQRLDSNDVRMRKTHVVTVDAAFLTHILSITDEGCNGSWHTIYDDTDQNRKCYVYVEHGHKASVYMYQKSRSATGFTIG